jgi:hypothetical protein
MKTDMLYIHDISQNFYNDDKIFRPICRENQKTHFVLSNFFFLIVPFIR